MAVATLFILRWQVRGEGGIIIKIGIGREK